MQYLVTSGVKSSEWVSLRGRWEIARNGRHAVSTHSCSSPHSVARLLLVHRMLPLLHVHQWCSVGIHRGSSVSHGGHSSRWPFHSLRSNVISPRDVKIIRQRGERRIHIRITILNRQSLHSMYCICSCVTTVELTEGCVIVHIEHWIDRWNRHRLRGNRR
ncbi:hypothetical protein PMAYCL1PPCAC_23928 [Pristionchus mayeri]|uniref:Uncharacterized protein n=1 Tax=Pristionchus mayeri TaxID=1317129 RepID=A0AAN5CZA2_9BILA|nr:hypothetical protein PMAYCL1PPCAC_23928 [Pristionchus mayeri]